MPHIVYVHNFTRPSASLLMAAAPAVLVALVKLSGNVRLRKCVICSVRTVPCISAMCVCVCACGLSFSAVTYYMLLQGTQQTDDHTGLLLLIETLKIFGRNPNIFRPYTASNRLKRELVIYLDAYQTFPQCGCVCVRALAGARVPFRCSHSQSHRVHSAIACSPLQIWLIPHYTNLNEFYPYSCCTHRASVAVCVCVCGKSYCPFMRLCSVDIAEETKIKRK